MTLSQASLLIIGLDPSLYDDIDRMADKPDGYEAVYTALKNAVSAEAIKATLYYDDGFGGPSTVSWRNTIINVSSIKDWLRNKNFTNNFFFAKESGTTSEFSDKENHFYAPKLDAALTAWKAITSNPELIAGRTPKQAIEKWLRQNANQYGLTKDNGSPNESAIEDICKVANWNLVGGVAKTTPQIQGTPTPVPAKKKKNQHNLGDISF